MGRSFILIQSVANRFLLTFTPCKSVCPAINLPSGCKCPPAVKMSDQAHSVLQSIYLQVASVLLLSKCQIKPTAWHDDILKSSPSASHCMVSGALSFAGDAGSMAFFAHVAGASHLAQIPWCRFSGCRRMTAQALVSACQQP